MSLLVRGRASVLENNRYLLLNDESCFPAAERDANLELVTTTALPRLLQQFHLAVLGL
jgi:hypothetical protein